MVLNRELKKQREMAAAAKEEEKKTYNSTTEYDTPLCFSSWALNVQMPCCMFS